MEDLTDIVLILPNDTFLSRAIWRGVISYMRPAKPWYVRFAPKGSGVPFKPHGAIAMLEGAEHEQEVLNLRVPLVGVVNRPLSPRIPSVIPDDESIGRAGAEYFLRNGFRHLLYTGMGYPWSDLRLRGFREAAAKGMESFQTCQVDDWNSGCTSDGGSFETLLQNNAKPVAVMACNDWVGWRISEFCRRRHLRIPEQVAVLGVDNDEIVCDSLTPQLSSIPLPLEQIGYHAASMLDGLLNREKPPEAPVMVASGPVVERASSLTVRERDPQVAEAMRYIQQYAEKPINVSDVLAAVKVSRRSLERKFAREMGCSLLDAIFKIRMEHARNLLARTTLPLKAVARRSGFTSPKRFSTVFRDKTGETPSQYRKRLQG